MLWRRWKKKHKKRKGYQLGHIHLYVSPEKIKYASSREAINASMYHLVNVMYHDEHYNKTPIITYTL